MPTMVRRPSFFLAAVAVSIACSAGLLALCATRVTSPIYIAWLTTSLALFYIWLCFTVSMCLRSSIAGLEVQPDHQHGHADAAVLRDNTAVEADIEDPRNAYSLSTFYWCSPGLQQNTAAASASASRTPETVIHKPFQSISGVLSTMQSSPMLPGLPPAAYFDSSSVDLRTAWKSSIAQRPAARGARPLLCISKTIEWTGSQIPQDSRESDATIA